MGRGPEESLEDLILRAVERVGEEELRTGRWALKEYDGRSAKEGTRNKANRYLYKLSTKNWELVINLEERTVITD